MSDESDRPVRRRRLLALLGLGAGAAYIAPAFASLSIANAQNASISVPSGPTRASAPSRPSVPSRPAPAALPSEHVEWCRNAYPSYRAEDNTYQTASGQRAQCASPHYDPAA